MSVPVERGKYGCVSYTPAMVVEVALEVVEEGVPKSGALRRNVRDGEGEEKGWRRRLRWREDRDVDGGQVDEKEMEEKYKK